MTTGETETRTGVETVPVYGVWEGSVVLAATPQEAWPYVLNYASWQDFSTVEHVSGPEGEEGEVVLLDKQEPGLESFPPYFAITIKIEPERRLIWKTYPSDPTSGFGEFFGIVDFKLEPEGAKTRFNYSLLYEFVVPNASEAELASFRSETRSGFEATIASIFPKLQKLVTNRASGGSPSAA